LPVHGSLGAFNTGRAIKIAFWLRPRSILLYSLLDRTPDDRQESSLIILFVAFWAADVDVSGRAHFCHLKPGGIELPPELGEAFRAQLAVWSLIDVPSHPAFDGHPIGHLAYLEFTIREFIKLLMHLSAAGHSHPSLSMNAQAPSTMLLRLRFSLSYGR